MSDLDQKPSPPSVSRHLLHHADSLAPNTETISSQAPFLVSCPSIRLYSDAKVNDGKLLTAVKSLLASRCFFSSHLLFFQLLLLQSVLAFLVFVH